METTRKSGVVPKLAAIGVVAIILVSGAIVLVVFTPNGGPKASSVQTGSSSPVSIASTQTTNETELGAFAPPAVYRSLGYPKQTVAGYVNGVQVNSSYIFGYRLPKFGDDAGSVYAPVMNLSEAVNRAAAEANLAQGNYSLSSAEFDPGILVNGTVWAPASWTLWFAQTYDGFWLLGGVTDGDSVYASVDTTTGLVKSFSYPAPAPVPETYQLKISSSQALQVIRDHGAVGNVPSVLALEGNVTSMTPRIVMFGASQKSAYFVNLLNSSLSGQQRL
ncbi:MAG TPA: hypothetical protein VGS04_03805, partial [Nitrososphaerales archaeon]|nr:hypothetical protein [Nitrososphaerales archaeon]